MLNYSIYKKLNQSLEAFEKMNVDINESYAIKDVRMVSTFAEPTRRFRGKDKIENEKEHFKNLIEIKGKVENYDVVRKNIQNTISPIYNIIISRHTKDQLEKRSNTHDSNYPLRSIESILPYITRSLLTGTLKSNAKFAYYFEGDHIAFIVTINATHSDEAKKNNDASDIETSPVIDIIVRSAITPEKPNQPIYIDSFTKGLTFKQ